jgi:hypothetical protein
MALSFIRVSDFTVQNEGTIYSLYANTEAAREWVNGHLPEDRMTWAGNGAVIEHRYICDIVAGIEADGLKVIFGACPDIASLPRAPKDVWPSAKVWIN